VSPVFVCRKALALQKVIGDGHSLFFYYLRRRFVIVSVMDFYKEMTEEWVLKFKEEFLQEVCEIHQIEIQTLPTNACFFFLFFDNF
jgi:hypothetical protein